MLAVVVCCGLLLGETVPVLFDDSIKSLRAPVVTCAILATLQPSSSDKKHQKHVIYV